MKKPLLKHIICVKTVRNNLEIYMLQNYFPNKHFHVVPKFLSHTISVSIDIQWH